MRVLAVVVSLSMLSGCGGVVTSPNPQQSSVPSSAASSSSRPSPTPVPTPTHLSIKRLCRRLKCSFPEMAPGHGGSLSGRESGYLGPNVMLLLPWLVKSGEPRITDTAITRTTTTMTICRLLRRISTMRQCYA